MGLLLSRFHQECAQPDWSVSLSLGIRVHSFTHWLNLFNNENQKLQVLSCIDKILG